MSQDLVTIDAEVLADLKVQREPSIVLDEARKAAVALKDVLEKKPEKVMMSGEQYLEFEDWQTVGKFYGVTCCEDGDPIYVELGEVKGFKASAVALHNGKTISRATAFCLTDEEKWAGRNKYAYVYCLKAGGHSIEDPGMDAMVWEPNPNKPGKNRPKKERILLGEESVPLFQLASMAQTRANAKVLRNVLSWVVVLAGYKPTPAEELPTEKVAQALPLGTRHEEMPPFQGELPPRSEEQQAEEEAGNHNPQDYISKLKLSESVREASQVLNDVLSDAGLSEEDSRALQILGKQRIKDLQPDQPAKRGQGARG